MFQPSEGDSEIYDAVVLGGVIAVKSAESGLDGFRTAVGPYQSTEGQRVKDSLDPETYPGERDRAAELGMDGARSALGYGLGKLAGRLAARPAPVKGETSVATTASKAENELQSGRESENILVGRNREGSAFPSDGAEKSGAKGGTTALESEIAAPKGIPGIDQPFRAVNPEYPANAAVVEKMNKLSICSGTDCSEIASTLQKTAGNGKVLTVTGQGGSDLRLLEYGKIDSGFKYHEVYTDGKYVYDPRLSNVPVPLGDWTRMVEKLNPGAVIK